MKVSFVNNLQFDSALDFKPEMPQPAASRLTLSTPPLGILLLAAILREASHEVEVIDFADLAQRGQIPEDGDFYPEAGDFLGRQGADVVAFTTRCDNYHRQLRIARELKSRSPSVPVIFGGPQATVTHRSTLELFPQVDFVVRNEAEETLPELLDTLAGGGDLATVAGLTWRRGEQAASNLDRPLIRDLDAFPIPAYELFPTHFDDRWPVEVGRGCPFSCTFCSTSVYFHRTYRLKSPERIVSELRHLRDRFGADSFMFVHDMLTVDRKRVKAICAALELADLGIRWSCSARIDCVNDDLLVAMRAAGCDGIYMGIEAGSQRMQKRLRKNLRLDRVPAAIAQVKEKGFAVTTSFITGFQEENLADVEETLESLLSCLLAGVERVQLHLWAPQAGSALFEQGRHHLAYDGYLSDQVDSLSFTEEDQQLILSHPEVFPGFYYVPSPEVPRELYRGLDFFGYACSYFPQTLYLALKSSGTTLLRLFTDFQAWLTAEGVDPARLPSMRTFHGLLARYLEHLIDSGAVGYPYLRDVLRFNVAYTRFQHSGQVIAQNSDGEHETWSDAFLAAPARVAPGVEVHDFTCDIRRLVQVVNEGGEPPVDEAASRKSSIALRQKEGKVFVLGLPVLCRAAVRLCDGRRSLGSVVESLEEGLLRTVPAERAAALSAGAVRQLVTSGIVKAAPAPDPSAAGIVAADRLEVGVGA